MTAQIIWFKLDWKIIFVLCWSWRFYFFSSLGMRIPPNINCGHCCIYFKLVLHNYFILFDYHSIKTWISSTAYNLFKKNKWLSWRNVCSHHTRILICVGTFRSLRHLSCLYHIWFHSRIRFLAYPFNKQCQSSLWWYWCYYHWHSLLIRFTSGVFSVLSELVQDFDTRICV